MASNPTRCLFSNKKLQNFIRLNDVDSILQCFGECVLSEMDSSRVHADVMPYFEKYGLRKDLLALMHHNIDPSDALSNSALHRKTTNAIDSSLRAESELQMIRRDVNVALNSRVDQIEEKTQIPSKMGFSCSLSWTRKETSSFFSFLLRIALGPIMEKLTVAEEGCCSVTFVLHLVRKVCLENIHLDEDTLSQSVTVLKKWLQANVLRFEKYSVMLNGKAVEENLGQTHKEKILKERKFIETFRDVLFAQDYLDRTLKSQNSLPNESDKTPLIKGSSDIVSNEHKSKGNPTSASIIELLRIIASIEAESTKATVKTNSHQTFRSKTKAQALTNTVLDGFDYWIKNMGSSIHLLWLICTSFSDRVAIPSELPSGDGKLAVGIGEYSIHIDEVSPFALEFLLRDLLVSALQFKQPLPFATDTFLGKNFNFTFILNDLILNAMELRVHALIRMQEKGIEPLSEFSSRSDFFQEHWRDFYNANSTENTKATSSFKLSLEVLKPGKSNLVSELCFSLLTLCEFTVSTKLQLNCSFPVMLEVISTFIRGFLSLLQASNTKKRSLEAKKSNYLILHVRNRVTETVAMLLNHFISDALSRANLVRLPIKKGVTENSDKSQARSSSQVEECANFYILENSTSVRWQLLILRDLVFCQNHSSYNPITARIPDQLLGGLRIDDSSRVLVDIFFLQLLEKLDVANSLALLCLSGTCKHPKVDPSTSEFEGGGFTTCSSFSVPSATYFCEPGLSSTGKSFLSCPYVRSAVIKLLLYIAFSIPVNRSIQAEGPLQSRSWPGKPQVSIPSLQPNFETKLRIDKAMSFAPENLIALLRSEEDASLIVKLGKELIFTFYDCNFSFKTYPFHSKKNNYAEKGSRLRTFGEYDGMASVILWLESLHQSVIQSRLFEALFQSIQGKINDLGKVERVNPLVNHKVSFLKRIQALMLHRFLSTMGSHSLPLSDNTTSLARILEVIGSGDGAFPDAGIAIAEVIFHFFSFHSSSLILDHFSQFSELDTDLGSNPLCLYTNSIEKILPRLEEGKTNQTTLQQLKNYLIRFIINATTTSTSSSSLLSLLWNTLTLLTDSSHIFLWHSRRGANTSSITEFNSFGAIVSESRAIKISNSDAVTLTPLSNSEREEMTSSLKRMQKERLVHEAIALLYTMERQCKALRVDDLENFAFAFKRGPFTFTKHVLSILNGSRSNILALAGIYACRRHLKSKFASNKSIPPNIKPELYHSYRSFVRAEEVHCVLRFILKHVLFVEKVTEDDFFTLMKWLEEIFFEKNSIAVDASQQVKSEERIIKSRHRMYLALQYSGIYNCQPIVIAVSTLQQAIQLCADHNDFNTALEAYSTFRKRFYRAPVPLETILHLVRLNWLSIKSTYEQMVDKSNLQKSSTDDLFKVPVDRLELLLADGWLFSQMETPSSGDNFRHESLVDRLDHSEKSTMVKRKFLVSILSSIFSVNDISWDPSDALDGNLLSNCFSVAADSSDLALAHLVLQPCIDFMMADANCFFMMLPYMISLFVSLLTREADLKRERQFVEKGSSLDLTALQPHLQKGGLKGFLGKVIIRLQKKTYKLSEGHSEIEGIPSKSDLELFYYALQFLFRLCNVRAENAIDASGVSPNLSTEELLVRDTDETSSKKIASYLISVLCGSSYDNCAAFLLAYAHSMDCNTKGVVASFILGAISCTIRCSAGLIFSELPLLVIGVDIGSSLMHVLSENSVSGPSPQIKLQGLFRLASLIETFFSVHASFFLRHVSDGKHSHLFLSVEASLRRLNRHMNSMIVHVVDWITMFLEQNGNNTSNVLEKISKADRIRLLILILDSCNRCQCWNFSFVAQKRQCLFKLKRSIDQLARKVNDFEHSLGVAHDTLTLERFILRTLSLGKNDYTDRGKWNQFSLQIASLTPLEKTAHVSFSLFQLLCSYDPSPYSDHSSPKFGPNELFSEFANVIRLTFSPSPPEGSEAQSSSGPLAPWYVIAFCLKGYIFADNRSLWLSLLGSVQPYLPKACDSLNPIWRHLTDLQGERLLDHSYLSRFPSPVSPTKYRLQDVASIFIISAQTFHPSFLSEAYIHRVIEEIGSLSTCGSSLTGNLIDSFPMTDILPTTNPSMCSTHYARRHVVGLLNRGGSLSPAQLIYLGEVVKMHETRKGDLFPDIEPFIESLANISYPIDAKNGSIDLRLGSISKLVEQVTRCFSVDTLRGTCEIFSFWGLWAKINITSMNISVKSISKSAVNHQIDLHKRFLKGIPVYLVERILQTLLGHSTSDLEGPTGLEVFLHASSDRDTSSQIKHFFLSYCSIDLLTTLFKDFTLDRILPWLWEDGLIVAHSQRERRLISDRMAAQPISKNYAHSSFDLLHTDSYFQNDPVHLSFPLSQFCASKFFTAFSNRFPESDSLSKDILPTLQARLRLVKNMNHDKIAPYLTYPIDLSLLMNGYTAFQYTYYRLYRSDFPLVLTRLCWSLSFAESEAQLLSRLLSELENAQQYVKDLHSEHWRVIWDIVLFRTIELINSSVVSSKGSGSSTETPQAVNGYGAFLLLMARVICESFHDKRVAFSDSLFLEVYAHYTSSLLRNEKELLSFDGSKISSMISSHLRSLGDRHFFSAQKIDEAIALIVRFVTNSESNSQIIAPVASVYGSSDLGVQSQVFKMLRDMHNDCSSYYFNSTIGVSSLSSSYSAPISLWPPFEVESAMLKGWLSGESNFHAANETDSVNSLPVATVRHPVLIAKKIFPKIMAGELQVASDHANFSLERNTQPLYHVLNASKQFIKYGVCKVLKKNRGKGSASSFSDHHGKEFQVSDDDTREAFVDFASRSTVAPVPGGGIVLDALFSIVFSEARKPERRKDKVFSDVLRNSLDAVLRPKESSQVNFTGYIPQNIWKSFLPLCALRAGMEKRGTATVHHAEGVFILFRHSVHVLAPEYAKMNESYATSTESTQPVGLKEGMKELILFYIRLLHNNIRFMNPLGWHGERQASVDRAYTLLLDFMFLSSASGNGEIDVYSYPLRTELTAMYTNQVWSILSPAKRSKHNMVYLKLTLNTLLSFFNGDWIAGASRRQSTVSDLRLILSPKVNESRNKDDTTFTNDVLIDSTDPEGTCKLIVGHENASPVEKGSHPLKQIYFQIRKDLVSFGLFPDPSVLSLVFEAAMLEATSSDTIVKLESMKWAFRFFLLFQPFIPSSLNDLETVLLALVLFFGRFLPSDCDVHKPFLLPIVPELIVLARSVLLRILRYQQFVSLSTPTCVTALLKLYDLLSFTGSRTDTPTRVDAVVTDNNSTKDDLNPSWILWRAVVEFCRLDEAHISLVLQILQSSWTLDSIQNLRKRCMDFILTAPHRQHYLDSFMILGERLDFLLDHSNNEPSNLLPFPIEALKRSLESQNDTHHNFSFLSRSLWLLERGQRACVKIKNSDRNSLLFSYSILHLVRCFEKILVLSRSINFRQSIFLPNEIKNNPPLPWINALEILLLMISQTEWILANQSSQCSAVGSPIKLDSHLHFPVNELQSAMKTTSSTVFTIFLDASPSDEWKFLFQLLDFSLPRGSKSDASPYNISAGDNDEAHLILCRSIHYLNNSCSISSIPLHILEYNIFERIKSFHPNSSGNSFMYVDGAYSLSVSSFCKRVALHPSINCESALKIAQILRSVAYRLNSASKSSLKHLSPFETFCETLIERWSRQTEYESTLRFVLQSRCPLNARTHSLIGKAAVIIVPSSVGQLLDALSSTETPNPPEVKAPDAPSSSSIPSASTTSYLSIESFLSNEFTRSETREAAVLKDLIHSGKSREAAILVYHNRSIFKSFSLCEMCTMTPPHAHQDAIVAFMNSLVQLCLAESSRNESSLSVSRDSEALSTLLSLFSTEDLLFSMKCYVVYSCSKTNDSENWTTGGVIICMEVIQRVLSEKDPLPNPSEENQKVASSILDSLLWIQRFLKSDLNSAADLDQSLFSIWGYKHTYGLSFSFSMIASLVENTLIPFLLNLKETSGLCPLLKWKDDGSISIDQTPMLVLLQLVTSCYPRQAATLASTLLALDKMEAKSKHMLGIFHRLNLSLQEYTGQLEAITNSSHSFRSSFGREEVMDWRDRIFFSTSRTDQSPVLWENVLAAYFITRVYCESPLKGFRTAHMIRIANSITESNSIPVAVGWVRDICGSKQNDFSLLDSLRILLPSLSHLLTVPQNPILVRSETRKATTQVVNVPPYESSITWSLSKTINELMASLLLHFLSGRGKLNEHTAPSEMFTKMASVNSVMNRYFPRIDNSIQFSLLTTESEIECMIAILSCTYFVHFDETIFSSSDENLSTSDMAQLRQPHFTKILLLHLQRSLSAPFYVKLLQVFSMSIDRTLSLLQSIPVSEACSATVDHPNRTYDSILAPLIQSRKHLWRITLDLFDTICTFNPQGENLLANSESHYEFECLAIRQELFALLFASATISQADVCTAMGIIFKKIIQNSGRSRIDIGPAAISIIKFACINEWNDQWKSAYLRITGEPVCFTPRTLNTLQATSLVELTTLLGNVPSIEEFDRVWCLCMERRHEGYLTQKNYLILLKILTEQANKLDGFTMEKMARYVEAVYFSLLDDCLAPSPEILGKMLDCFFYPHKVGNTNPKSDEESIGTPSLFEKSYAILNWAQLLTLLSDASTCECSILDPVKEVSCLTEMTPQRVQSSGIDYKSVIFRIFESVVDATSFLLDSRKNDRLFLSEVRALFARFISWIPDAYPFLTPSVSLIDSVVRILTCVFIEEVASFDELRLECGNLQRPLSAQDLLLIAFTESDHSKKEGSSGSDALADSLLTGKVFSAVNERISLLQSLLPCRELSSSALKFSLFVHKTYRLSPSPPFLEALVSAVCSSDQSDESLTLLSSLARDSKFVSPEVRSHLALVAAEQSLWKSDRRQEKNLHTKSNSLSLTLPAHRPSRVAASGHPMNSNSRKSLLASVGQLFETNLRLFQSKESIFYASAALSNEDSVAEKEREFASQQRSFEATDIAGPAGGVIAMFDRLLENTEEGTDLTLIYKHILNSFINKSDWNSVCQYLEDAVALTLRSHHDDSTISSCVSSSPKDPTFFAPLEKVRLGNPSKRRQLLANAVFIDDLLLYKLWIKISHAKQNTSYFSSKGNNTFSTNETPETNLMTQSFQTNALFLAKQVVYGRLRHALLHNSGTNGNHSTSSVTSVAICQEMEN